MPPWELVTGGVAAVVVLITVSKLVWDRMTKLDDERHASDAATIARVVAERDLALAGWREQTSLTNAAVAAFAAEREDRRSRHRLADDR